MSVANLGYHARESRSLISNGALSHQPEATYINANQRFIPDFFREIDQIVNDVEMQAPPSEGTSDRFFVIDTNVLLDHLDGLKAFVEEVMKWNLPIVVIFPGIVIYELERQKIDNNARARLARHACAWLLGEVMKKGIVKGQADDETCISSGSWKKRERGQDNDDLVLDCCQYYSRQQLRTYLCTADNNLRLRSETAERGSIQTISPISPSGQWRTNDIFSAIFKKEADVLERYRTRNVSNTRSEIPQVEVSEDISMDVDENLQPSPPPSHPLDQLHELVVAEFSKLLDKLVLRVAEPGIQGTNDSMHAPKRRKKPLSEWTPEDCLAYLNSNRKIQPSTPSAGVFLTLPHSKQRLSGCGRRGQDWPREAWDEVIRYLSRLGHIWGDVDTAISESVGNLEFAVEERFAMKMRPTGT